MWKKANLEGRKNTTKDYWQKEIDNFLGVLSSIGCQGIELASSMIWDEPVDSSGKERLELRQKIEDSGLKLTGLQALLYTRKDLLLFKDEGTRQKILDYLIEYPISNIIVDSRQYPFRANETIQHWINHIYMPQIVDFGIKRYAIIVEKKVTSMFEAFEDTDDMEEDIQVEYFSNTEEAETWITEG